MYLSAKIMYLSAKIMYLSAKIMYLSAKVNRVNSIYSVDNELLKLYPKNTKIY
jgi:hypothetical protein